MEFTITHRGEPVAILHERDLVYWFQGHTGRRTITEAFNHDGYDLRQPLPGDAEAIVARHPREKGTRQ